MTENAGYFVELAGSRMRKSTILEIVMGLLGPSEGTVRGERSALSASASACVP
jgi:ABC-type nitrate/sulfonate/bicarbonate transport system ATPase subunit